MKPTLLTLIIFLSPVIFAHDGGHGPKLTDGPKQGGTIAPVVNFNEAHKGADAQLQFKSEFVRSEDGTLRLFIYDKDLNPVALTAFDKAAKGVVEVLKKGKVTKKLNFDLTQQEGAFVGKAPRSPSKPYNIYVILKSNKKEYLTELSHVD